MLANQSVEERITALETRMSALEQLPGRIDRLEERIDRLEVDLRAEMRSLDKGLREEIRTGHVMLVTTLTEQIEDTRRHMLVLHEDVLDRFRLVWEKLGVHDDKFEVHDRKLDTHDRKLDAHGRKLDAHDRKLDEHGRKIDALADKIDAAQNENRAMFAQILSRLDAPRQSPNHKRR